MQRIITSKGINDIFKNYIGNNFKYIALGNGKWNDTEIIPLSTTKLRHEILRKPVNMSILHDNIVFEIAYTGEEAPTITEAAIVNTETESDEQIMLAMKVFNTFNISKSDAKVIRFIVGMDYASKLQVFDDIGLVKGVTDGGWYGDGFYDYAIYSGSKMHKDNWWYTPIPKNETEEPEEPEENE